MINTLNLNSARKQIQELKKQNKAVVVRAKNEEFNRKMFENKDIDMVVGLEFHNRKDKMKQRDSGLNEVLCKLGSKNNIKIGIDINEIRKLKGKEKARVFARIMQNIKLCRRTKTKIVLLGVEDRLDVMGFMQCLGGSTGQGKEAV